MNFSRLRILPLLIFVAMLSFSVRLAGLVVTGVPDMSGSAMAADAAKTDATTAAMPTPSQDGLDAPANKKPEEAAKPMTAATDAKAPTDKTMDAAKAIDPKDKDAGATPVADWKDASDSDLDVDDVKTEMYAELSKRRAELDKREAALVTKEALLQAAEQELDRKYQELDKVRGELKKLLDQQQTEQSTRIDSLVKVYEGMKPKDAARIFDTLDTDVLLSVMSKMSERKLSPVLAEMNAERAKTMTTMMAEQKQLPETPEAAAPSN